jgi:hypothetical protein
MFHLERAGGDTYDIPDRVRGRTDHDEKVEDIELNLDGGDITLILDNEDGFFVADGVSTGILEAGEVLRMGTWRLKIIRGMADAADELVTWSGILNPNWTRIDRGTRIKAHFVSYVGYAKEVTAWDGGAFGRTHINISMAELADKMRDRLDSHGDMDTDVQLETIPFDNRYFQMFEGFPIAEDFNADPGYIFYVKDVGDESIFWHHARTFASHLIKWNRVTQTIDAMTWVTPRIFSIHRYGRLRDIQPAADAGGGESQFWLSTDNGLYLIRIDVSTATASVVYDYGIKGETITVSADGTTCYVHESQHSGDPYGDLYSVTTASATVTTVYSWSSTTRTGYVFHDFSDYPLGPLVAGLIGGVSTPTGAYIAIITGTKTKVIKVADDTSTDLDHAGLFSDEEPSDISNDPGFHYLYVESSSNYWGMLIAKKGALPQDRNSALIAGLLVDNKDLGLPTDASPLRNGSGFLFPETRLKFDPSDGVGLLYQFDEDNEADEDQEMLRLIDIRPRSDRQGFTVLVGSSVYGIGIRSFDLGPAGAPWWAMENRTSVFLTSGSSYGMIDIDEHYAGEDASGLGSMPANFFIQPIYAETPQDAGEVLMLVHQDQTAPAFAHVQVFGRKCYQVLQKALQAINANLYIVWDDVAGNPVLVVRSRGMYRGSDLDTPIVHLMRADDALSWGHVYDGVVVRGGFGLEGKAGDTTSPGARVLEIDSEYISPSYHQGLADALYAFHKDPRRPFIIEHLDAPHWEPLDRITGYVEADRRNATVQIRGRRVNTETNRALLEALEL